MNFIASLFRKPHTEVRYVAATKGENNVARALAIQRRLELAVAVSRLTPEEAQSARMRGMGGGR